MAAHKKTVFLFLGFFLLLQACFISSYLPFNEWLSSSLIYTDDYPLHYGDMLDKKFFMNNYCSTWGYNPFQRAGTVVNVTVGIDNNAWALLAFLLPFVSEIVVLKLYFIVLILVIPLLLYGSARNFELGRGESLGCVALGTFFVHMSICADFIYWGTVSYISSAYLSLYIASLTYRFLRTGKWGLLVLQTVLLGAALWIHIFTVVNCLPFIAVMMLYCVTPGNRKWQRLALQTGALLLSAVPSTPWLIPFLKMLDQTQPHAFIYYTTANFFEWANTYFRGVFLPNTYAEFPKTPYIDTGLMLLGIAGLVLWKRAGASMRTTACGCTIVFLFLLAYFGSFISFTRTLTPLRFAIMMNVLLVLPASSSLCWFYERLAHSRFLRMRLFVAAVGLLLLMVIAQPYYHLFVKNDLRFLTKMPRDMEQLIDYIKTNTTDAARVLIENSDFETDHQYARGHFPHILPHLTERQYIGNDCAYTPTKDSKVSFLAGKLFQQPIETLNLEYVARRCDLYNIGWVICWTPQAKTFFNHYPDYFIPDGAVSQFSLYRVNRKPSFFLRGTGKARADMNWIELTDLVSENGEVIISYHWMKYLATDPPTDMEPAMMLDDPISFIKLKNPPSSLRIYNRYY